MNELEKKLLKEIADLDAIPVGAYNIRENGKALMRNSTEDIIIEPKKDKSGINITVKAGVKNKSVHIPVLLTQSGFNDLVYNDFFIGEDCDVVIVAGCGIHNDTCNESRHDGIHRFFLKRGSRVRYVEKHLGEGSGAGKVLNPVTDVRMAENSYFLMETTQIGGVTDSVRTTKAVLSDNAELVIKEKILTENDQTAKTRFNVRLKGLDSRTDVQSRSVARGNSYQDFDSTVIGDNRCYGHVSCDGILIDSGRVDSAPKIRAKSPQATLVHEAAIGKIAGEQLLKLMTLGLTEQEAEDVIIRAFL